MALGWGSGWGAWGEPQTPSLPVLGVATGVGSSTTADSAPTMRLLPVPCNQPLPARAPALPTAAPPQWSRFANAFPPSPRGEGAGIRDMYRKDPGETRRQLALDLLGSQEDEEDWASPSLLPDAAGASSENPGGRVAATPALPPSEERVDPEAACLHASKTAHLVDAPACDGEEANRARKRQRLSEILLGTTDGARAGGCTREPLGQLREKKCKGREFLTTDRRDAQARPRGTPGYDGRTLLVPQQYMSELTPTMQQFWRVKRSHADCVVFFKLGKFYELFDEDSDVGARVCGLKQREGKKSGFPERSFAQYAVRLVAEGYRVAVVEQVRTANASAKAAMERRVVAILSPGTLLEPELQQLAEPGAPSTILAVGTSGDHDAFVVADCYSGTLQVHVTAAAGSFQEWRHALESIVSLAAPAEVLLPAGLSPLHRRAVEGACRRSAPSRTGTLLVTEIAEEGWDDAGGAAAVAIHAGRCYWEQTSPSTVQQLADLCSTGKPNEPVATATAFALLVTYLREAKLDELVLPRTRVLFTHASTAATSREGLRGARTAMGQDSAGLDFEQRAALRVPHHLAINPAAVANLELVTNVDGGHAGTLLAVLCKCRSPAGRRMLRSWMLRPLAFVAVINSRQQATRLLLEDDAIFDACTAAQQALGKIPDLARATAAVQRHAPVTTDGGAASGNRRHAAGVVLYDSLDAASQSTRALADAMAAARGILDACASLDHVRPLLASSAPLLDLLSRQGSPLFPSIEQALAELEDFLGTDDSGQPCVREGADAALETALAATDAAENALAQFLEVAKGDVAALNVTSPSKNKPVTYSGSYALVVSKSAVVPSWWQPASEYVVSSKSKTCNYTCVDLQRLLKRAADAEEKRRVALEQALGSAVLSFCASADAWAAVAQAAAELDALVALGCSARAMESDGPVCFPTVSPPNGAGPPTFEARDLRHPTLQRCASALAGGGAERAVVPSDIHLGSAGSKRLLILSGPNMGGKSTLMRAVALVYVLAQMGAAVPATSCRLRAATRLFVRMGAQDSITEGEVSRECLPPPPHHTTPHTPHAHTALRFTIASSAGGCAPKRLGVAQRLAIARGAM